MSKKSKQRRQHHQPSGQRSSPGPDKPRTREVTLETAEAIIGRPYGPPATTSNAEAPPGVAEYRERMAEGAIPAAFRARERGRRTGTAAGMVAALEDESQGLAQRLAQGLSPDELAELAPQIARAASIGGTEGGYVFTTGSGEGAPDVVIEGVPDESSGAVRFGHRGKGSRKSPGPIPAGRRVATQPREEMALGPVTRAVLDAAPHREAGDPAVLALRASDVLDMHAQLAGLMARPTDDIVRYYTTFIQQTISEAHASGGAEQAREYWENMFWPATTAREWTSILARLLQAARTYQITAEMMEKVTEQYAADLASGSYAIGSDDLPWPAGFAWLDAPLTFTDKFGKQGWNRAVSWGPEILQTGRRRVPGSRIVSWSWHDDRDGWWRWNDDAN